MVGSTAVAASSNSGTQPQPQLQSQPAAYIMSARVRKMIQSIKEIVGNFSDADVYVALKESNMDPNETAQKLLNQDPFHEVRRKKDRKKESMGYRGSGEFRRGSENFIQGVRTFNDRNGRRGGYIRHAVPSSSGLSREFRVVRDNRVNGTTNRELKSDFSQSSSSNEHAVKGSTATSNSSALKASTELGLSQATNGPTVSQGVRHNRDANLSGTERRANLDEKRAVTPGAASRGQGGRPNSSQNQSATVIGVYSSSTDPVHVPSPDARPSAAVGAIKREVGVVGGRRQNTGSPMKDSSATSSSLPTTALANDSSLSESFQPFLAISKNDQVRHQANASEAVVSGVSVSRSFLGGHYNSKPHQQTSGHQKGPQHNKEWKPKTSKKSIANEPGVIGMKSSSPIADNSKRLEADTADLSDKLSLVNVNESQNVIIAQHIRVPETDRCMLTFGSFGIELDSTRNFSSGFSTVGVTEENNKESTASSAASAMDSTGDDASCTKHDEVSDEKLRHSGSVSPSSGGASEPQLPDKSPSSPNLDTYSDIGLVQESSPSYDHVESHQQQQDPSESQSFQGYDSHAGYGMSYFRPSYDETARGQQGLPSPQESLASHTAHSIPSSTISMVQQQQPQPIATQMYPQVHMPHFANMMPFRQFVSPVYLPQMAMPGYSSNAAAYAHPSNGSSYVLMPGGASHLNANGIKYGVQQFKTVPGSNPSVFGNFASPTGYAMNAPGVVGNGTGLEDPSRIKYKDGNLYVANAQAETSEMWIQNPRELPSMQSAAQYYNMTGQTPHAAAYLPSHPGHASFNAAAAQSSHIQFSGLYPSPQPAGMANPHHMGPPVMGGGVGVGVAQAAPGGQVGAYQQQPQLGHLNWTTNF